MGILTGPEIEKRIAAGDIRIDPFDPECVGPNSYDLHLSDFLLVYRASRPLLDWYEAADCRAPKPVAEPLDMARENLTETLLIPEHGLVVWPGVLYLGCTAEYTETLRLAPVIETRSSVARLGLQAHLSAGFGDQNYKGTWTLELAVEQPLRIYSGIRICQIAYSTLEGGLREYQGKYQGNRGPKPSFLWREFVRPKEQPGD